MNSTVPSEKKSLISKVNRPILIAGPCSAETKDQVLETALRLKATNKVDIYRAGVWKPRTRPNSFEGVGKVALPWLSEVRETTQLPVTVEVAKASHVELCLKYGIDILWIGARTTANPFAIQEIADALKGVKIPVLVKNPINPDLALWLGGMERMEKAGIEELGAIHRGFSNLGEKYYRNRPQWQIPLEFKRLRPDLPLINDPSHICGRRDILQEVAQKAMDLDFDGIMIESHITPDEAWSDAAQQITPEALGDIISSMVLRMGLEDEAPLQNQLEFMRQEINHIDDELINLLSNRMSIARDIALYKKDHDMTILQQKRWNAIIEKSKIQAKKLGLSETFILKFIAAVHDESIDQQSHVFNNRK